MDRTTKFFPLPVVLFTGFNGFVAWRFDQYWHLAGHPLYAGWQLAAFAWLVVASLRAAFYQPEEIR